MFKLPLPRWAKASAVAAVIAVWAMAIVLANVFDCDSVEGCLELVRGPGSPPPTAQRPAPLTASTEAPGIVSRFFSGVTGQSPELPPFKVRAVFRGADPARSRAVLEDKDGRRETYHLHDLLPDSEAEIITIEAPNRVVVSLDGQQQMLAIAEPKDETPPAPDREADPPAAPAAAAGNELPQPYLRCQSREGQAATECYQQLNDRRAALIGACQQYARELERMQACIMAANELRPY